MSSSRHASETVTFTQFGHLSFWLLLFFIIMYGVKFFIGGVFDNLYADSAFLLLLLILLLVFHKLTITVHEDRVAFAFGLKLIVASYKYKDLEYCRPVRNHWLYGVGIRIIPSGMLYNVSGLQAIELKLKKSGRIVRIGTNRAGVISQLVQKRIEAREANHQN